MENEFDFDVEKIDAKFILLRLLFWLFILSFVFFVSYQEKQINTNRESKKITQQDTLTINTHD